MFSHILLFLFEDIHVIFCMYRLGHMVAVFKYSTVTTYSVALPPEKLEFSSSVNEEFLKKDFEDVCLFTSATAFYPIDAFKYLAEHRSYMPCCKFLY